MAFSVVRKIICIVVLGMCLGFVLVTPVLALPVSVGFSPSGPVTVSPGTPGNPATYSWDIVVSNLPVGQVVAAYDFDVHYDPNLLKIDYYNVDFKLPLGVGSQFLNIYNPSDTGYINDVNVNSIMQRDGNVISVPNGTIDIAAISWMSGADLLAIQGDHIVNGTIVLATLNFTALSAGSTSLSYDWYIGQDIKGYSGEVIGGYSVPEPSTMLLFCSGIVSLMLFRRKFNRFGQFFGK